MMKKISSKKILVISFSDLSRDPRVNKQVRTISEHYETTFAGFGNANIKDVNFIALDHYKTNFLQKASKLFTLAFRMHEFHYWNQPPIKSALEKIGINSFDLIVANDIDSLPLAIHLARNAPVYFDAHEYHPREFEDKLTWRLLYQSYKTYLCKEYIPKCSIMTTVCNGIANEYKRNFKVSPIVVKNLPDYLSITPSDNKNNTIKLIHHGAALPSRNLEAMIDAFEYLDDRFSMDFMLINSNDKYFNSLKNRASAYKNIKFIPPVNMTEISKFINSYDAGVYLLAPNSFNNKYALPNKLFEYIQARIAIAIGPSPEMAPIVRDYSFGVVSADFTSKMLAEALLKLTRENINFFKQNCEKHAKNFSFDTNKHLIIRNIKSLIE